MLMKKRTFTNEEKIRIVKEASENGVTPTCEKYGLYAASYYSWKKKLDQMGVEGLQHGMIPVAIIAIENPTSQTIILSDCSEILLKFSLFFVTLSKMLLKLVQIFPYSFIL